MLKCQPLLAFNNYEQDKFRAQLSCALKKFYNLGQDGVWEVNMRNLMVSKKNPLFV